MEPARRRRHQTSLASSGRADAGAAAPRVTGEWSAAEPETGSRETAGHQHAARNVAVRCSCAVTETAARGHVECTVLFVLRRRAGAARPRVCEHEVW